LEFYIIALFKRRVAVSFARNEYYSYRALILEEGYIQVLRNVCKLAPTTP
jgi:hypothetical protein